LLIQILKPLSLRDRIFVEKDNKSKTGSPVRDEIKIIMDRCDILKYE
jgi:hypothetical protein